MSDMKHPHWLHLERRVSRHGVVCWYVRRGHGLRMRLRALFGTPEFEAEYLAALRGEPPSKQKGPPPARSVGCGSDIATRRPGQPCPRRPAASARTS